MLKVDLHTHSSASVDGGIRAEQYQQLLTDGRLDALAITDHNRIDMAVTLRKSLGNRIIVGEEITTTGGEIIGLFLHKPVQPNLSPLKTVQAIKGQGGIVYIPHPFETVRRGLSRQTLEEIAEYIDIVEVYNGRAVFQNRGPEAVAWARLYQLLPAASSDAHGIKGIGSAYTLVNTVPTRDSFMRLFRTGRLITTRPPLFSLLSPKFNRVRNRLRPGAA